MLKMLKSTGEKTKTLNYLFKCSKTIYVLNYLHLINLFKNIFDFLVEQTNSTF